MLADRVLCRQQVAELVVAAAYRLDERSVVLGVPAFFKHSTGLIVGELAAAVVAIDDLSLIAFSIIAERANVSGSLVVDQRSTAPFGSESPSGSVDTPVTVLGAKLEPLASDS